MANTISTMGQSLSLINRVKQIQADMSKYQLQVSTGVKYQNFKEYGVDSLRIQRYRADLGSIASYIYNIDTTQVNIKQMDASLSESVEQAGHVLTAISLQLSKGSEFDMEAVKNAADSALQIIESNVNQRVGDRYLFAGSDVSNKPLDGSAAATGNVQARISDWLDGTSTTTAFISGIEGMTDSQSGFSSTVQSAKKVYTRADDSFEVDITVTGNTGGFKEVINGLRVLSEMTLPVEGVDQPTTDDFYTALDQVYKLVQTGVESLRESSGRIAAASQTLNAVRENHTNDKQNLLKTLENTEAADTTDAIIKFQALQNQLEASFQVTSILSQMSLTRLLGS